MEETLQRIDSMISGESCCYVVTPNLDHIVRLERDAEFAEAYKNANLVLADGKPLLWISKWLRNPIKEKISGSDLFPRMCQLSAKRGYSVFLLGAAEGVAAKAAENLKKKYSGLKITGTYAPVLGFENNIEELECIKTWIRKADNSEYERWGIERKSDNAIVGNIDVNTVVKKKYNYCNVGYTVRYDYWGEWLCSRSFKSCI